MYARGRRAIYPRHLHDTEAEMFVSFLKSALKWEIQKFKDLSLNSHTTEMNFNGAQ